MDDDVLRTIWAVDFRDIGSKDGIMNRETFDDEKSAKEFFSEVCKEHEWVEYIEIREVRIYYKHQYIKQVFYYKGK